MLLGGGALCQQSHKPWAGEGSPEVNVAPILAKSQRKGRTVPPRLQCTQVTWGSVRDADWFVPREAQCRITLGVAGSGQL